MRAVALGESILKLFKNNIASLNLIPSDNGIFEVKYNEEIIFSKHELNRYPEEYEIEKIVKEKL